MRKKGGVSFHGVKQQDWRLRVPACTERVSFEQDSEYCYITLQIFAAVILDYSYSLELIFPGCFFTL